MQGKHETGLFSRAFFRGITGKTLNRQGLSGAQEEAPARNGTGWAARSRQGCGGDAAGHVHASFAKGEHQALPESFGSAYGRGGVHGKDQGHPVHREGPVDLPGQGQAAHGIEQVLGIVDQPYQSLVGFLTVSLG